MKQPLGAFEPITMRASGWSPVILLFGIALLGGIMQWASPVAAWKDVLHGLYYIPIVIAAINLGLRAALSVALLSGICFGIVSVVCGDPWIRPFSETVLFACVGIAAAKMAHIQHGLTDGGRRTSNELDDRSIENAFQSGRGVQQVPGFGQIVAGLVRRFRTPVSSIEGAVWLLEDARFPDDKRDEFVKIIRKESHQLNAALSDIQEFTQPRSPRLRNVNLPQILDEVIASAGPKDHAHFFLFQKDIPDDLPPLTCDPELISKVFLNLARNAIQATPGGGQIVFSARVDKGTVIISVKDPGRGMPAHIIDRIFDPFFTTRGSGLGLGLTVARQIVHAHGGTMAVEESSERGATLSVTLPLRPPNPHDHGSHISS